MDCDKFEATLLDELYGELDELTLAASKRHAAGCARCAALINGLRATRRLVTLPVLAPSEGFEGRLLSAVAAAEGKPKLGWAEVVSLAGRWAMRPQTAMAAVFLLMFGTMGSVLLSRRVPRTAAQAAFSGVETPVTVTENGAPAAAAASAAPAAAPPPMEPAGVAHGTAPLSAAAPPAAPLAMKSAPAFAAPPDPTADGINAIMGPAKSRTAAPSRASSESLDSIGSLGRGAAGGGGADLGASRFSPPPPPVAPAANAPATPKDDAFASAKQQYTAGDYAGAAQSFDALAASGDQTAALWAARSVRDGSGGCLAAASRLDAVAGAAWGTQAGYDAEYEAAQCYARLNQSANARVRFGKLLTVPSYASRAQAGISVAQSQVPMAKAARSKPTAIQQQASPAAQGQQAAPAAAPSQSELK